MHGTALLASLAVHYNNTLNTSSPESIPVTIPDQNPSTECKRGFIKSCIGGQLTNGDGGTQDGEGGHTDTIKYSHFAGHFTQKSGISR